MVKPADGRRALALFKKRGYTVKQEIGKGSYSKVFYAEWKDKDTGKVHPLACKVVNRTVASKSFLKKFFPREVNVLAHISHPNIVHVHSILQYKDTYYIFTAYIENGTILNYLRRNGAIAEKQARIWFFQILQAVEYLHLEGITHRDVKCENVLLTKSLGVKLCDFGFSRWFVNDYGQEELSSTFCGSLSYVSPEIIQQTPYDCKKADIWSLGIMLFIMLNRCMPFTETNPKKMLAKQLGRSYKYVTQVSTALTNDAKSLIQLLLEPVPEFRLNMAEIWEQRWIKTYTKELKDEKIQALRKAGLLYTPSKKSRSDESSSKDEDGSKSTDAEDETSGFTQDIIATSEETVEETGEVEETVEGKEIVEAEETEDHADDLRRVEKVSPKTKIIAPIQKIQLKVTQSDHLISLTPRSKLGRTTSHKSL